MWLAKTKTKKSTKAYGVVGLGYRVGFAEYFFSFICNIDSLIMSVSQGHMEFLGGKFSNFCVIQGRSEPR